MKRRSIRYCLNECGNAARPDSPWCSAFCWHAYQERMLRPDLPAPVRDAVAAGLAEDLNAEDER